MNFDSRIFVAGHNGLVGRAIVKGLRSSGFSNLILKSRGELDLLNTREVENFFLSEKPEFVFNGGLSESYSLQDVTDAVSYCREILNKI